jgi:hypothetical protein
MCTCRPDWVACFKSDCPRAARIRQQAAEAAARIADDRAAQAEAIIAASANNVARRLNHDARKREATRIAALIRHGLCKSGEH